jgi:hypothetical protein
VALWITPRNAHVDDNKVNATKTFIAQLSLVLGLGQHLGRALMVVIIHRSLPSTVLENEPLVLVTTIETVAAILLESYTRKRLEETKVFVIVQKIANRKVEQE